jgi:hypothetical protein
MCVISRMSWKVAYTTNHAGTSDTYANTEVGGLMLVQIRSGNSLLLGGHEHLLQPASSASLANNQSFASQRSLGFSRSIDEAEPLDLALA